VQAGAGTGASIPRSTPSRRRAQKIVPAVGLRARPDVGAHGAGRPSGELSSSSIARGRSSWVALRDLMGSRAGLDAIAQSWASPPSPWKLMPRITRAPVDATSCHRQSNLAGTRR